MHVLFLSPRADVIAALLRDGARVTLLLEERDRSSAAHAGCTVLRVRSVDSLDEITAIASQLASGDRPDRVISGTERGQFAAGVLANLLERSPTQLRTAVATRNKRRMKDLAQASGAAIPGYASLLASASRDQAAAALAAVGAPAVLKPVAGGGTRDTFTIASVDELVVALRGLDGRGAELDHLLLERMVTGREYHCDVIWHDGEPLFAALSQYFLPVIEWVEHPWQGGSFYVEPEARPGLYDRVLDLHRRVNRCLGVEHGVTHLELFEDAAGGLIFSEVATRLAGSFVSQMYATRFGASLAEMWSEYLVHGRVTTRPRNQGKLCAWLNVPAHAEGEVTTLPTADELARFPEVLDHRYTVAVGDCVTRELPYWVMQVAVVVDDEAHLARLIDQLDAGLTIETSRAAPPCSRVG